MFLRVVYVTGNVWRHSASPILRVSLIRQTSEPLNLRIKHFYTAWEERSCRNCTHSTIGVSWITFARRWTIRILTETTDWTMDSPSERAEVILEWAQRGRVQFSVLWKDVETLLHVATCGLWGAFEEGLVWCWMKIYGSICIVRICGFVCEVRLFWNED